MERLLHAGYNKKRCNNQGCCIFNFILKFYRLSKIAIIDKAFIDLVDLAGISFENADTVAGTVVVGIAFDGIQKAVRSSGHYAGVAQTATQIDDEQRAWLYKCGIGQSL